MHTFDSIQSNFITRNSIASEIISDKISRTDLINKIEIFQRYLVNANKYNINSLSFIYYLHLVYVCLTQSISPFKCLRILIKITVLFSRIFCVHFFLLGIFNEMHRLSSLGLMNFCSTNNIFVFISCILWIR